jgi:hypothetical protein
MVMAGNSSEETHFATESAMTALSILPISESRFWQINFPF